MITLIPIEPLNDAHGILIVEAFNNLFINWGGQSDGWGNGNGSDTDGSGRGYGAGRGRGYGNGNPPEEWLVKP